VRAGRGNRPAVRWSLGFHQDSADVWSPRYTMILGSCGCTSVVLSCGAVPVSGLSRGCLDQLRSQPISVVRLSEMLASNQVVGGSSPSGRAIVSMDLLRASARGGIAPRHSRRCRHRTVREENLVTRLENNLRARFPCDMAILHGKQCLAVFWLKHTSSGRIEFSPTPKKDLR
jgi:hypothetical protein